MPAPLPRIALVALALLSGCGGTQVAPVTVTAPPPGTLATAPQAPPPTAGAPGPAPGRPIVHLTRRTALRASPGGPVLAALDPTTEFGSATVLPVLRRSGDWLGVYSTALPNGRIGWIAVGAGLVSYRTHYSVTASLSRREVTVRRDGRVVQRFPVAVGSPSTPTPTGRFAVTDKLLTENPGSPYGCCILALSARQARTPQGWGGGDRVAIHATNLPETIGSAASLGCLRGPADAVRRAVYTVPLGTLVTIRA